MSVKARLDKAYSALSSGQFSTAAEMYSDLANEGVVEAQRFLGWLYEQGKGLAKDEERALLWYERASTAGDEWACLRLGGILEKRMLIERAKQCYLIAADKGAMRAAYRLGMMYRRYGPRIMEFQEAVKWLKFAEQRGHVWSDVMISHLMLIGTLPGGKLRVVRRAVSLVLRVARIAFQSDGKFEKDERLLR